LVTKEEKKGIETTKKKLKQVIECQTKPKSKITLNRKDSIPLGKGNDSTPIQKKLKQRAKTTKAKLENRKELTMHICKPPLTNETPPGKMHVLTVKIRQPSHEFTFGVGMSFIPYPLVLTPVV
jgi:phenylalanyl-tRNA synthetase alpha subunit